MGVKRENGRGEVIGIIYQDRAPARARGSDRSNAVLARLRLTGCGRRAPAAQAANRNWGREGEREKTAWLRDKGTKVQSNKKFFPTPPSK